MIDDKRVALIHREIDGENTPGESAEFQALVASDPEAHRIHEELLQVHRMLDAVPEADPPADLKPGILRAIRTPVPAAAPAPGASGSWRESLAALFTARRPMSLAYGFAAGIAVGVLGFALLSTPGVSLRGEAPGMTGTVVPPRDFTVVDRRHVEEAGVVGTFESRAGSGEIRITLDLESAEPAEVVMDFDAAALVPVGFDQPSGAGSGITLSESKLEVTSRGRNRYELRFGVRPGSAPSDVHLTIRSGGTQLETSLKTRSEGR